MRVECARDSQRRAKHGEIPVAARGRDENGLDHSIPPTDLFEVGRAIEQTTTGTRRAKDNQFDTSAAMQIAMPGPIPTAFDMIASLLVPQDGCPRVKRKRGRVPLIHIKAEMAARSPQTSC